MSRKSSLPTRRMSPRPSVYVAFIRPPLTNTTLVLVSLMPSPSFDGAGCACTRETDDVAGLLPPDDQPGGRNRVFTSVDDRHPTAAGRVGSPRRPRSGAKTLRHVRRRDVLSASRHPVLAEEQLSRSNLDLVTVDERR